jgi:hypothetical protein
MDGGSDPPGQVDVGGRDYDRIGLFLLNRHNAIERMFVLLGLLQVTRKIDYLVFMLPRHAPLQRHDTGGILVVDAVTGLAQFFMRVGGRKLHPLPTPFVVDHSTYWALRGLAQLSPQFVGIADTLILGAAKNAPVALAAGAYLPMLRHTVLSSSPRSATAEMPQGRMAGASMQCGS